MNDVGEGINRLDTALPSTGKKLLRLEALGVGDGDGDGDGARRPPGEGKVEGGTVTAGEGSSSGTGGGESATTGVVFSMGPNDPVVENRTSI